jgi:hypothetical protein
LHGDGCCCREDTPRDRLRPDSEWERVDRSKADRSIAAAKSGPPEQAELRRIVAAADAVIEGGPGSSDAWVRSQAEVLGIPVVDALQEDLRALVAERAAPAGV